MLAGVSRVLSVVGAWYTHNQRTLHKDRTGMRICRGWPIIACAGAGRGGAGGGGQAGSQVRTAQAAISQAISSHEKRQVCVYCRTRFVLLGAVCSDTRILRDDNTRILQYL